MCGYVSSFPPYVSEKEKYTSPWIPCQLFTDKFLEKTGCFM